MFMLWATGLPSVTPDELETALDEELQDLVTVSDEEVARAVAMTETQFVRGVEHVGDRADMLSMFDRYFDDPARLNSEVDRLRAVSPEDLKLFTEAFLGTDNRAVLAYVPKGAA